MKVWLVLGSDLRNDPCSDVMGVFGDERGARDYVKGSGKEWWEIVSMVVDEPKSWAHETPTCMACAHGAELHLVSPDDDWTVCAVVNCACANYAGGRHRLGDGTFLPLCARA